jgi:hypothetical protein
LTQHITHNVTVSHSEIVRLITNWTLDGKFQQTIFSTKKKDVHLLDVGSFNQKYSIGLDDETVNDLRLATPTAAAQLQSVNREKLLYMSHLSRLASACVRGKRTNNNLLTP